MTWLLAASAVGCVAGWVLSRLHSSLIPVLAATASSLLLWRLAMSGLRSCASCLSLLPLARAMSLCMCNIIVLRSLVFWRVFIDGSYPMYFGVGILKLLEAAVNCQRIIGMLSLTFFAFARFVS
jgi:hypothetical protein